MLTLDECKEALASLHLPDEEVQKIKTYLEVMSETVIKNYISRKQNRNRTAL